MDGVAAHHLLGAWEAGRSGLRRERPARRLTRASRPARLLGALADDRVIAQPNTAAAGNMITL